ncbi:hypothetical protein Q9Q95_10135 [Sphingomonas sp. DG1-23]|uniref:hypothetical protein n=1 Tax=Sphingomonas sp. DG1-23 TaxID=3068316 RepID=UPI00273E899B|nr:hypothetical protein [Sphingomonas sp. DG1-23]MDP5279278.1 hypothetical protein [Sphingomonas sp. DG1-23]
MMRANKEHLPGRRPRADGWTPARQRKFLERLRETGCVRDACRAAAISSTSAYRARRDSAEFAAAWARAQARGMANVEQAAFDRAVLGWDEVVTREGREISRRKRYSDSLLRVMLQRGDLKDIRQGMGQAALEKYAEETAKAAGGWFENGRRYAGARDALMRKLAEIEMRSVAGTVACPHCRGDGRKPAETPGEIAEAAVHDAELRAELAALEAAELYPVAGWEGGA